MEKEGGGGKERVLKAMKEIIEKWLSKCQALLRSHTFQVLARERKPSAPRALRPEKRERERSRSSRDEVVKDFYERVTGFKVTMMQPQGAHFILLSLVNVTDVIVRYV